MELANLYLIPAVARAIQERFDGAEVVDATELITGLRLVQSPEELEVTRRAAAVTDAMMQAAVATAAAGVTEREVAAAALEAMMEAGASRRDSGRSCAPPAGSTRTTRPGRTTR